MGCAPANSESRSRSEYIYINSAQHSGKLPLSVLEGFGRILQPQSIPQDLIAHSRQLSPNILNQPFNASPDFRPELGSVMQAQLLKACTLDLNQIQDLRSFEEPKPENFTVFVDAERVGRTESEEIGRKGEGGGMRRRNGEDEEIEFENKNVKANRGSAGRKRVD